LPFIPGVEASGIVIKMGNAVRDFNIGDEVYGAIDHSYAEHARVIAKQVFIKPAHISFDEAAAVGGAKTAWGALFELAQLKKDQRVLVHGASGGVGVFAVQLARLAGAYVIAPASEKNMAAVQALGAHQVVDYKHSDFEKEIEKVDVVLDAVGGEVLQKSYGLVKTGGILLSIVQQPSTEKAAEHGIRAIWGGTKTLSSMIEVDRRLHLGEIKPVVSKTFISLRQAGQAQDYSQYGSKEMGKIVLRVN
jgi:NADPH:quinone reductase-like Zn-dependent oxidoreductase